MRREIDIEQRHIDEGSQGSSSDCAIARAIKERTGERVHVNSMSAFVDHQRFDIGEKGRHFIEQFDKSKSLVSPTQLTLSPYFPTANSMREYEAQMYHHQVMKYSSNKFFTLSPEIVDQWKDGEVPPMMTTTVQYKYKPYAFGVDFGV